MSVSSARQLALVTGASRGIGRAIAIELAKEGFDIIINYLRNESAAQETLRLVESYGARGWLAPGNVGEQEEIEALFAPARECGYLDVLVHNAAIGTFKDLLNIRQNQLELAFRVNVFALLWLAKSAIPFMHERRGRIIALSSIGSSRVVPYYGIVGPSKAALEALVRYLAVELKPQGISVNAVSGGFIDTDALYAFPNWEGMTQEAMRRTPAGRIGQATDLAQIVRMLASGNVGWLCGQVLIADGGFSLQ